MMRKSCGYTFFIMADKNDEGGSSDAREERT
jgi:hypothetical protein